MGLFILSHSNRMKFDGDKGPKKFQVLIQVVALGGAYVAGESLRDW